MNGNKLDVGKVYDADEFIKIKQANYNPYIIVEKLECSNNSTNNIKYKVLQIIENCAIYLSDSGFCEKSQESYKPGIIIVKKEQ